MRGVEEVRSAALATVANRAAKLFGRVLAVGIDEQIEPRMRRELRKPSFGEIEPLGTQSLGIGQVVGALGLPLVDDFFRLMISSATW